MIRIPAAVDDPGASDVAELGQFHLAPHDGASQRMPEADRMGEVLKFGKTDGGTIEARIVSPVFYDPEGEKQDV